MYVDGSKLNYKQWRERPHCQKKYYRPLPIRNLYDVYVQREKERSKCLGHGRAFSLKSRVMGQ